MQQKLLRQAGLMVVAVLTAGVVLTGCIDEPNPPVLDRITSEVRFVHAVPDAPGVDIWVDGEKMVSNVGFKGVSPYLVVKSGNRFIRLVPAGADTGSAVFRRLVSVRSLTKMTMAFYNTAADVQQLITQERFTYADETSMLVDSCDVKLINLGGGEQVKLARKTGETTSEDLIPLIAAGSLSSYRRVLAGAGDFYIVNQGSQRVITFPFDFQKPGYRYSLIVVGTSLQREVLTLQDEPK